MTSETSTQPDYQTDKTTNGVVYGTTVMDHLVSTSAPLEYTQTTRNQQESSTFIEIESNFTETTVVLTTTSECRLFSDFQTLTIKFENLPSSYNQLRKFKNVHDKNEHFDAYQKVRKNNTIELCIAICLRTCF